MILILDSTFKRLGVIKKATSAERVEEINGENTLSVTLLADEKMNSLLSEDSILEVDSQYFDVKVFKNILDADGIYTIEIEADHISYRLNDPDYNVEYFTEMGTGDEIGVKILEDTPFNYISNGEFYTTTVTYSLQEKMSRRQVLMEIAQRLNAEIVFDNWDITFKQHLGSTIAKQVIKDRNVTVLSRTVNKRELDGYGNPTISYECTPVHTPLDDFELGDLIKLDQIGLNLHETLRVVSINHNPYDESETIFVFSSKLGDLSDSIFYIETEAVLKDALYNSIRIGPVYGFEAIRNDRCARAYFRSDEMKFQSGDGNLEDPTWKDRLYYEYDSENDETTLVFNGKLTVDALEAMISIITPLLLADVAYIGELSAKLFSADKAYITELTVDKLETSDKVQRFLNNDISDVDYIKIEDQVVQFISASVIAGGTSEATTTGSWSDAQTDTYYKYVKIDGNGIPQFSSSEEGITAVEAISADRRYRAKDDSSYYHLTGILDPDIVTYEVMTITLTGEDNFEQVADRRGGYLFWFDENLDGASEEETDFPVYIYKYNEVVKMEHSFNWDTELNENVPKIALGVGGDGDSGTGSIYKGKTGLHIDYTSSEGNSRQILMNDAGILLTPFAAVGPSALTVDQLVTENKINHYLNTDTSDVNYVSIIEQVVQFITAAVDTEAIPNFEQYTNRNGNPLYWFDATHAGITTDETPFPVYVYKYIESVKMEMAFYEEYREEGNIYIPRITLGAGTGVGDNGKGTIYKGSDGLTIEYYTSDTGDFRQIIMNNDGIFVDPQISLGEGTGTDDNGKGFIKNDEDGVSINYNSSVDGALRQVLLNDDGIEFTPTISGVLKTGTINAVNVDDTVDILVGGVVIENVPYLSSYTPTEGDDIIYGETI